MHCEEEIEQCEDGEHWSGGVELVMQRPVMQVEARSVQEFSDIQIMACRSNEHVAEMVDMVLIANIKGKSRFGEKQLIKY